ncbi:MAG: EAL domain-containing protein, partial [Pseudomonadota bacterium]
MTSLQKSALDLIACEQEPIHRPQAVQACCVLLLFDRENGRLTMGSDNLEGFFGAAFRDLVGSRADAFFDPEDAAALEEMMFGDASPVSRYLKLRGERVHFARMFEAEDYLGIELNAWEDAQDQPMQVGLDVGNTLNSIEARARGLASPTDQEMREVAQFVAEEFRRYSGYDRAMVYRFDSDWNGEIIAESRSEAAPGSFLGLSFPSSDIPAQARRLFVRNRVRPVLDAGEGAMAVLPALNPKTGQPVDLSDCSIRAVSPVHIEYLENMGVRATLNIALMAKGKLWGLVSNHHYSAPYRLTPARAATCRLLAEIFSTELTRLLDTVENHGTKRVRDCLRSLRKALLEGAPDQNLGSLLAERDNELLEVLGCDGAALIVKDDVFCFGTVPEAGVLRTIERRTDQQILATGGDHFATHYAVGLWPDLADRIGSVAAGVFACKFPSEDSGLIMFRTPREKEITWGGDPYKRVQPGDGDRIHPRKSFEKFSESVKDRAEPWEAEMAAKARECVIGLSELDWILAWRKAEQELAESRAEVAHAALHDALTNLPNRRYLMDMLAEQAGWSAVLHLDLDGFKQINDRLGHAAGDLVLIEVASRLRSQIRSSDFCARVGGDEFVVLCCSKTEAETIALGERLVAVMSQPVHYGDETCEFGTSIGIAFTRDRPEDPDILLNRADVALYESKRLGRGRVTVHSKALEDRVRRDEELGEDILIGMREGQFQAWYQPQVDAHTHKICGVETLVRWDHPKLGILTADKFLEVAGTTSHMGALDAMIMERALNDYRGWQAQGLNVPSVSLNVSNARLSEAELIESIRALGVPTDVFSFELLENTYIEEASNAVQWNIDLLRHMGLRLEIDNFGTGKTSIVSLVRFKPDRLKIDRQLIAPIVQSEQSRQLV